MEHWPRSGLCCKHLCSTSLILCVSISGQFQCAHGMMCIEKKLLCDGVPQCQDRSDEVDCFNPGEGCVHRCDKKRCISEPFICDGEADCDDGSDEADCGNAPLLVPVLECPFRFVLFHLLVLSVQARGAAAVQNFSAAVVSACPSACTVTVPQTVAITRMRTGASRRSRVLTISDDAKTTSSVCCRSGSVTARTTARTRQMNR